MLSFYDLPVEAQRALREQVDSTYLDPEKHVIQVVEDPEVPGTYAIRVVEPTEEGDVHLVWYHYNDWELVEFESWPPQSGNLQF